MLHSAFLRVEEFDGRAIGITRRTHAALFFDVGFCTVAAIAVMAPIWYFTDVSMAGNAMGPLSPMFAASLTGQRYDRRANAVPDGGYRLANGSMVHVDHACGQCRPIRIDFCVESDGRYHPTHAWRRRWVDDRDHMRRSSLGDPACKQDGCEKRPKAGRKGRPNTLKCCTMNSSNRFRFEEFIVQ
jgi:hypothetical protein